MQRRDVLKGLAATATLAAAGCAPLPAPAPVPAQANSRVRTMTDEESRAAGEARETFRKTEGATTNAAASPSRRASALLSRVAAMPVTLTDRDMLEVGRELAAIVREAGGVPLPELVVPPRSVLRVSMAGFCLDASLPAPMRGDPLRLLPAARYFDPALGGLEGDVLRHAARNGVPHHVVQHVLWGLREIREDSYFARSLAERQDLLALLEAARPGAADEVRRQVAAVRLEHAVRRELTALVRNTFGYGSFSGEILSQLIDPVRSRDAVEARLRSLYRPVEGAVPDLAAYSRLAGGVYARAAGTGPLVVGAALLNSTPRPWTFVPAAWVAESMLPQQRVAFSRAQPDPGPGGGAVFDLERFVHELARLLAMRALGTVSVELSVRLGTVLARSGHAWLGALYPPLSLALRTAPVISNVLSLVEAFDEDKSPAERLFALLGSIPGYGSLLQIARSGGRLAELANRIAASAPAVFRSVDRASWMKDLADAAAFALTGSDQRLWEVTQSVARQLVQRLEGGAASAAA